MASIPLLSRTSELRLPADWSARQRQDQLALQQYVTDLFAELTTLQAGLEQSEAAARQQLEDAAAAQHQLADQIAAQLTEQITAEVTQRLTAQFAIQLEAELQSQLEQLTTERVASETLLQQQITDLETEREALDNELEEVRGRAVEMADTIARQTQQLSEQRLEWTDELRQLRKILDKQSHWLHEHPEGPATSAGASGLARVTNTQPDGQDRVVDSVVSQFETLQKDVARRRAQTRSGKK